MNVSLFIVQKFSVHFLFNRHSLFIGLLSEKGYHRMSGDQSWLTRFRSSSVSSVTDVNEIAAASAKANGSRNSLRKRPNVCDATFTTLSAEDYNKCREALKIALVNDPDCFPFNELPESCKLSVFAALNPGDRGIAAQVCREWSVLMRSSIIWSAIDMHVFPPYPSFSQSTSEEGTDSDASVLVYEDYRKRVKRYISYLVKVKPKVKTLSFEFDIGDVRDGWCDALQALFCAAQLQDLEIAHIGWTDTPCKPYCPEMSSATWNTNDTKDLMYRHRHRQRIFVKFFDLFTAVAPNVISLTIPFDWTERSLRALRRLQNVEVLELQKYFIVQTLDQTLINNLLGCALNLRRLTMEVWSPSGKGLQSFRFQSDVLEFLDMSNCRGFCFDEVQMPSLEEIHVSMCLLNGPLPCAEDAVVKCLYDMLRVGAPMLRQLNDKVLKENWKDGIYDELEELLKVICVCPIHYHPDSE